MAPSQPAFPTQRAFVVQVHADAQVTQGRVWGRVEHMVSGQAASFQSLPAMLNGVPQQPIEGVSMVYTFADVNARSVIY
jgi:hypothetical protein